MTQSLWEPLLDMILTFALFLLLKLSYSLQTFTLPASIFFTMIYCVSLLCHQFPVSEI